MSRLVILKDVRGWIHKIQKANYLSNDFQHALLSLWSLVPSHFKPRHGQPVQPRDQEPAVPCGSPCVLLASGLCDVELVKVQENGADKSSGAVLVLVRGSSSPIISSKSPL